MFKYSLIILAPVFLFSCSKLLDTTPDSFVVVDDFYNSLDEFEIALTGCYEILVANQVQDYGSSNTAKSTFAQQMHIFLNAGTDELTPHPSASPELALPYGFNNVSVQDENIKFNFFLWFAGINRINLLLDEIDKAEFSGGFQRIKEIKGEAHFLRGFIYTYLAWMYGGVPVYKTVNQDATAPRDDLETVYDLIIDDLQYAYDSLPDRAQNQGRANRWSAAGYLAKVYSYLGSAKINDVGFNLNSELNNFNWVDENDMYSKSLKITQDIIDNSGYELIEDYSYLFYESTESYKDKESLFMVSSTEDPNGSYIRWSLNLLPHGTPAANGGGNAWLRPTVDLWRLYESLDKRLSHNFSFGFASGRDNPIETIDGVNYFVPRVMSDIENSAVDCSKFRYMDPLDKKIAVQFSTGSTPLLRYADILLLHAENLYFNGRGNESRQFLYQVRKRAAGGEEDLADFLQMQYRRDDLIQEILEERSRELCFEAWRRIDLIRFGKLEEAVMTLDTEMGPFVDQIKNMKSNWEPYKIWFPIPRSEIDLNENMTQNPGYIN